MTFDKSTRWNKNEFVRKNPISDQDKQTMADYLQAGLKMGKHRDGLLQELAEKYQRSTRQIERYIAQCSPSEEQIDKEKEATSPKVPRLPKLLKAAPRDKPTVFVSEPGQRIYIDEEGNTFEMWHPD